VDSNADGQLKSVVAENTGPLAGEALLRKLRQQATTSVAQRTNEIESLQREVKDLKSVEIMAEAAVAACESSSPGSALFAVENAKQARTVLAVNRPAEAEELDVLLTVWRSEVDAQMKDTARTFPAAVTALGLDLDSSSRDPKYTFAEGFINVVFDKSRRTATVQTRGGKKELLAPDPRVVAARVAEEHTRCFGRRVDLRRLVKRMRSVYAAKLKTRPGRPGVPILEIFEGLRAVDKTMVLDEFMIDLSKVVRADPLEIPEAAGSKFDHTKDPAKGVLLPGLETQGYYGYVQFIQPDKKV
jgi:hypothetical protein